MQMKASCRVGVIGVNALRAGRALLLGAEMKKGRLEADLFKKQMVPRRGLGHTSATPAALASAAFRVLAQSAQALCFLGQK
ncbi:hypothetical protein LFL97_09125 [Burkholderia sp. JSH-S8]|uniref:hypothetical protein n=1 Tax=Burkholderia stagnalis TaxID=1503054 RepID=UPI000F815DE2|nr:hypothetical protein [Burkholderia stagnalis]WGS43665.1 hypothetical protein LFL97_09125 [Burkholderia sp. JSH-S8]